MNSDFELPPPPPALPVQTQADAEFTEPLGDAPPRTCPNCGAPAHGPYCYACGQSEKGMIRHLSEVMSDMADIVFNVDSRIFRSLWDLYVRPGFLTTEYLAGRRARYVTPFRMFFFLSVIAFFAIQVSLPDIDPKSLINTDTNDISSAQTAAEVNQQMAAAIGALNVSKGLPGVNQRARAGIERSIEEIRHRGEARLKQIEQAAKPTVAADGSSAVPAVPRETTDNLLEIDGTPWDFRTNPFTVSWLSDGLNTRLNNTLVHMQSNAQNFRKDPQRLLTGWIAVLPQTLFVVMPLFAILLKLFYLFKRRLYMEHLLVALHSHAFIFLSVLVILLLGWLSSLVGEWAWLVLALDWLRAAAWVWLFAYLWLMQKRVYRQGFWMTSIKYCVIGYCYSIFLVFALAIAALISLALT